MKHAIHSRGTGLLSVELKIAQAPRAQRVTATA